jgi:hypothetical protein
MTGFFIKKAFFDGWDNLFGLIAFNAVHLLLALMFIALPIILSAGVALGTAGLVLGIVALSVWQAVTVFAMNEVSDYKSPSIRESLAFIRLAWKPGLAQAGINVILWFSFSIGIPFYLAQKSLVGTFFASILFWICIVVLLASQWFLPLCARRSSPEKPVSITRQARIATILLADNPAFSIFLFIYNSAGLALSLFTAFIVPGFAGLALACTDALKLRLMKYEYLESTPGANRKKLPWHDLLAEERELVGERTLKGMIFPWKDIK